MKLTPAGLERAIRGRDWIVCTLLVIGTTVTLATTSAGIGVVRDEGWHILEARHYLGWFHELATSVRKGNVTAPFSKKILDPYWTDNPSHPVLVRVAMGATWTLFSRWLPTRAPNLDGFRLAGWFFAGLSVALTYYLGRMMLPVRAAVFAALLWLSIPHVFWHMHLGAFDVPVAAAQLWIAIGYLKLKDSIRGAALLGILFGLGLATKHNVLIMPIVFLLHWLVEVLGRVRRPTIPWPVVFTPFVGLAVFVLLWPYLWPAPYVRLISYWRFHLHHENYPVMWFGTLLTHPPFPISFPFVLTAITVPLPTLVTFVGGTALGVFVTCGLFAVRASASRPDVPTCASLCGWSASSAWFMLLNAFGPFLLIALPSTPKFGGTKHWMGGLPFLCILAAWFVEEGVRQWQRGWSLATRTPRRTGAIFAVLAFLILAPSVWTIWRTHPFELDSYNELVGFTRGAANAGMQRTFWGSEARVVLPFLNRGVPPNCAVQFGDTNQPSVQVYSDNHLLRPDVRFSATLEPACAAIVEPQGEFKDLWMDIWNHWDTRAPVEVVHLDGVPLAVVVDRP